MFAGGRQLTVKAGGDSPHERAAVPEASARVYNAVLKPLEENLSSKD